MTGFASLTHEDERATIAVTVRAVNHRFLDLQLRVPHAFGDVEPRLRTLLQKRLARGRVEVGISVQVRDLECADRRVEHGGGAGAVGRDRSGARAGTGVGRAEPGRSSAPAPGDRRARAINRSRPGARSAHRGEHRSRGRAGAGRSGCHARSRRHAPGGRSRCAGVTCSST